MLLLKVVSLRMHYLAFLNFVTLRKCLNSGIHRPTVFLNFSRGFLDAFLCKGIIVHAYLIAGWDLVSVLAGKQDGAASSVQTGGSEGGGRGPVGGA